MKQALLCVSVGTDLPAAQKTIETVEQALRQCCPGRVFFRVFTGRRSGGLASLRETLLRLQEYDDLLIQPTHLLYGREYEAIRALVREFSGSFARLQLGRPLLAAPDDLCALAGILSAQFSAAASADALVLLGHGTDPPAQMTYPALQTAFRAQGEARVYVGTIRGWPDEAAVEAQLRRDGRSSVLLAPLMLTAGRHTLRDLAGSDGTSWRSRLEAAGFSVRCHLEGIGALPAVQALYCGHLRELSCGPNLERKKNG